MILKKQSFVVMLITLVLSSFLVSSLSAKEADDFEKTRITYVNYLVHQTPTEDGIGINLVELTDSSNKPMTGAVPVLLVHGYTKNFNIWFQVADQLRQAGFRVFVANLRGHGQGKTRSVGLDGVSADNDPRMVFDNLPAFDAPAMVNFVYKKSGNKKVIYAGHSMGAMLMHLALAGVTKDQNGKMIISKTHQAGLKSKIKTFVAIGGPVFFDSVLTYQQSFADYYYYTKGINLDESLNYYNRNFYTQTYIEARRDYYYGVGLYYNQYEGLLNHKNISRFEYGMEKEYQGSNTPRPLIRSIQFTSQLGGYKSADKNLDYSKLSMEKLQDGSVEVQTIVISAELDTLAPLEHQNKMTATRGLEQIIMKDTGHIDMYMGRNIETLVSRIKALQ